MYSLLLPYFKWDAWEKLVEQKLPSVNGHKFEPQSSVGITRRSAMVRSKLVEKSDPGQLWYQNVIGNWANIPAGSTTSWSLDVDIWRLNPLAFAWARSIETHTPALYANVNALFPLLPQLSGVHGDLACLNLLVHFFLPEPSNFWSVRRKKLGINVETTYKHPTKFEAPIDPQRSLHAKFHS